MGNLSASFLSESRVLFKTIIDSLYSTKRKNWFEGANSIKFHSIFLCDEVCLEYLTDLKWNDGYNCCVASFLK